MDRKDIQMKQDQAEQIVEQYMKPVYAFVIKRISHVQDAQDVAQDICLKLYRSLCQREIDDIPAYVWTVARHSLANYYRGKQRNACQISLEEWEYDPADEGRGTLEQMIQSEDCDKIRREIAYLSKIQRKVIILYYFEEKKQSEIAELLNIPLGTVKWHLNVAKNELRKGMNKMRDRKDLVFDPVTFNRVGLCGGTGQMGSASNFFRSALSQNIVYSICREPLTVEEIADTIGVSPVYVESELDFLEEYSLVRKKKNHYTTNILVEEIDQSLISCHQKLYTETASKMANLLYDRILEGNYISHKDIYVPDEDVNYMMWTLIPYLLAWAKSDLFTEEITFDEVAELRADGGKNIITATVKTEADEKYLQKTGMKEFSGPCWNGDEDILLWVADGDWTETRITEHYGGPNFASTIRLLKRFAAGETLSPDEYAFLLQNNYIRKSENRFEFAIVVLKTAKIRDELLALTKEIKNEVLPEITEALFHYKQMVMSSELLTAAVKKQQQFLLQHMFYSDGWLILYAEKALLQNGRLKLVEGKQKYSVTQLLVMNK